MIVLDTHVWVWWIHNDPKLAVNHKKSIQANENDGIGVCSISLWEVSKLVELGRLELPISIEDWFISALDYPGIVLLDLNPHIAVESTNLPPPFHRDPADQIIVATARVHACPLLTADQRIQDYPHVITPQ